MAKTLLYYYFREKGVDCSCEGIYTQENMLKNQEICPHLHFSKLKAEHKTSSKKKLYKAAFFKDDYKVSPKDGKRFVRISFDADSFLSKVRELKTTPFALETLVCFKAMRDMMKGEEPIMSMRLEASLRQVFDFETTHNFVTACRIQCTPSELDMLAEADLCREFRSSIN